MDIMNIMKVSSSKFTFSLIAFAALLISGSGLMINDAYGAPGFHAPEFTCNHINTTATHCTFDQAVNGTLAIADWGIRILNTATDGDITYDVAISNIANSTSTGIGTTVPSAMAKVHSSLTTPANAVVGLGFINGTDFVLIHAAIPSDARYYINYTNNPNLTGNQTTAGGSGAIHTSGGVASLGLGTGGEGSTNNKMLKIGSNATAQDWIVPTAVSAEVLKSNPSQVRILMSETVANINVTEAHFTMVNTGPGNAAVSKHIGTGNGTSYILVNLQNPVIPSDVLTVAYTSADFANGLINTWITDAIDSTKYTNSGVLDSAEWDIIWTW